MSNLTDLPNIGKKLEERLHSIGVSSPEELAALGSVEAVIRIGHATGSDCYNMLYALEGAIQGVRWHSLPTEIRKQIAAKLDERLHT